MKAIFIREMKAYFTSPIAYMYLAIFYLVTGFFFYVTSPASMTTSMEGTYSIVFTISLILIPFITMRLMSEDKKQKTDQLLLTSPTSLFGIVLGKFFSAFTLYSMSVAITVIYALSMASSGTVDYVILIGNIIGTLLLGGALISVGILISSLTENQFIAAIVTLLIGFVWALIDSFTAMLNITFIQKIFMFISIYNHYYNFTVGLFDLTSIIFFLSVIGIFLFATTRVLEKRRWS